MVKGFGETALNLVIPDKVSPLLNKIACEGLAKIKNLSIRRQSF